MCLYAEDRLAQFWVADHWSADREAWVNPHNGHQHENLHYVDTNAQGDIVCWKQRFSRAKGLLVCY